MEQQSLSITTDDLIRALGQHRLNEILATHTISAQDARIKELTAEVSRLSGAVVNEAERIVANGLPITE